MTTNKTDKLANLIATEIAATESKAFADMALAALALPKAEQTTDKAIAASVTIAKLAREAQGEDFSANMATDWKSRIGAARAFLIAEPYGVNEARVITLTPKTTEAQARKAAVVLNDTFLAARKSAQALQSRYVLSDVPSEHARKVYLRDLSSKAASLVMLAAKDKDGKATKDAGRDLITLQTESGMIDFLAAMFEAKKPAPVAAPAAAPAAAAPAAAPVALPKITGASDRNVQDVPAIRDAASFKQAIAQVAAYAVAHGIKSADLAAMLALQMQGQAKRNATDLPGEL